MDKEVEIGRKEGVRDSERACAERGRERQGQ